MAIKKIPLFISILFLFISFAIIGWFIKAYKMPPELKTETGIIANEMGASFRISDFKGQYVLLSYFQTWCGDCIEELQSMDELQTKVGKKKIKIILVSDEPWKKINHFKEKFCNTLNYYQSVESLNSQNIRVFPTTYLLDKNGSVLMSKIKSFNWCSMEVLQYIK